MPTCFPYWSKETNEGLHLPFPVLVIQLQEIIQLGYLFEILSELHQLFVFISIQVCFHERPYLSKKKNKPHIVTGKLTKGHATPTFQSGTEAKIPCK